MVDGIGCGSARRFITPGKDTAWNSGSGLSPVTIGGAVPRTWLCSAQGTCMAVDPSWPVQSPSPLVSWLKGICCCPSTSEMRFGHWATGVDGARLFGLVPWSMGCSPASETGICTGVVATVGSSVWAGLAAGIGPGTVLSEDSSPACFLIKYRRLSTCWYRNSCWSPIWHGVGLTTTHCSSYPTPISFIRRRCFDRFLCWSICFYVIQRTPHNPHKNGTFSCSTWHFSTWSSIGWCSPINCTPFSLWQTKHRWARPRFFAFSIASWPYNSVSILVSIVLCKYKQIHPRVILAPNLKSLTSFSVISAYAVTSMFLFYELLDYLLLPHTPWYLT